jgi:hypothetical protein
MLLRLIRHNIWFEAKVRPIPANALRKKIKKYLDEYGRVYKRIQTFHLAADNRWNASNLDEEILDDRIPYYTIDFNLTKYKQTLDDATVDKFRRNKEIIEKDLIELGNKNGWTANKISSPSGYEYNESITINFSNNYSTKAPRPRILYHVTRLDKLESIQKHGIKPMGGTRYQPRVYLFNNYNIVEPYLLHHSNSLGLHGEHDGKVGLMALLTIDTSKIRGNFYTDNEFVDFFDGATDDFDESDVVWTYAHIKPSMITSIKIIVIGELIPVMINGNKYQMDPYSGYLKCGESIFKLRNGNLSKIIIGGGQ